MKKTTVLFLTVALLLGFTVTAGAQEGETWKTQEMVHNVTLIRIHPNMDDQYLNNLKRTWVTAMKEAVKEGQVLDYKVYASVTPNAEGYNLAIVTTHANLAALDATDEWRAKVQRVAERTQAIISEEESDRITGAVYPNIRTIMSQTLLREIQFME